MALLRAGSEAYSYGLELAEVARIWRGGSTIRTVALEDIYSAYRAQPDLPNLLLDSAVAHSVMKRQEDLRTVVHLAVRSGTPSAGHDGFNRLSGRVPEHTNGPETREPGKRRADALTLAGCLPRNP